MEEMPEYQICEKCRKRGTPNMKKCWNCGTPYPGFACDENIEIFSQESSVAEYEAIESIKPCELEDLDFCKKLFAYNLLLNGELNLSFCDCRKCTDSLSELLAFIMETEPESEALVDEIKKIDRSEFRFDTSVFRTG